MAKARTRHGAKNRSYKTKEYVKVEGTFESIVDAISNGATIEVRELWMKTEYWLIYKEGGASKISKKIYDKILNK